jgi:hypothetical protein
VRNLLARAGWTRAGRRDHSRNRATYEREVTAALVLWADHVRAIVEHSERKIVPLKKPA